MAGEHRADLGLTTASVAETLLVLLGADRGRWRIELYAEDGRVRKWSRQEEGGRDELLRRDAGVPGFASKR